MIRLGIIDSNEHDRAITEAYFAAIGGFKIVGLGQDSFDAIHLAKRRPDVFICDIGKGDSDGPLIAPIIKRNSPSTEVVIYTRVFDDNYILRSLHGGVKSCLLKNGNLDELFTAVNIVYHGGIYFSPPIAQCFHNIISNMVVRPINHKINPLPRNLTRKEIRILYCISQGLTNQEIASQHCVVIGTVRNAVSSIMRKVGMRSRSELAVFAVKHGINL